MLIRPWLWSAKHLHKVDLHSCPFEEFQRWFSRAQRCWWIEFPEAMHLSTITADLKPQGRFVLLKSFDQKGFVFFTNSNSQKGVAIEKNSNVSLTFYWEALHRQIRIEGTAQKVSASDADEYFKTRPRKSQIGAWASAQSSPVSSRDAFETNVQQISERYRGVEVPRPDYWNGYLVTPLCFEFWQMCPNRLHDRFRYTPGEHTAWDITRLYP